ncbi:MAG: hypothetical protein AAF791_07160 [Bacteroidota bacterium]
MKPTEFPEVALFPEHRYALAQPRGEVKGETIVAYGRAMAYHPDWQPGFTEVWDATLSESVDMLPSDIPSLKTLEEETQELLKGSTTIIAVNRPMVRMSIEFYAALVRPFGRKIVSAKTQKEVATLLGIDELPVLT